MFFSKTVHKQCPYNEDNGGNEDRCLKEYGCRGPETHCDCPIRKWNSPAAGSYGVNWCVGAGRPNGAPCHGCTEPTFPDGMEPFYTGHAGGDHSDDSVQVGRHGQSRATAQTDSAAPATSDATAPSDPTADPATPQLDYQKRLEREKRLHEKKAAAQAPYQSARQQYQDRVAERLKKAQNRPSDNQQ